MDWVGRGEARRGEERKQERCEKQIRSDHKDVEISKTRIFVLLGTH